MIFLISLEVLDLGGSLLSFFTSSYFAMLNCVFTHPGWRDVFNHLFFSAGEGVSHYEGTEQEANWRGMMAVTFDIELESVII